MLPPALLLEAPELIAIFPLVAVAAPDLMYTSPLEPLDPLEADCMINCPLLVEEPYPL
jgi:hypothetical protein